ncbi:DsbA family protein [Staphylococcus aureus]|uniref:DsbA family protein n=1 Tax=Staphylococcus aureus TaxID=1280 RepID=UPI00215C9662|nr:DsbA family protein [Staphylococcus aureus]UVI92984.1 DsbA family protein [Staphylococcus aureus]
MKSNRIVVLTSLAMIIIFISISFFVFKQLNLKSVSEEKILKQTNNSPVLGRKGSSNLIVVFIDFNCPFCKEFDEKVFQQLNEKYIKKGKAEYRIVNAAILGKDSLNAARAAHAVNIYSPEKYWEFQHKLFEEQSNSKKEILSSSLVDKKLNELNIHSEQLRNIKKDYKTENSRSWKLANKDKDLFHKLNLEYVPSVYVNGVFIKEPNEINNIEKEFK